MGGEDVMTCSGGGREHPPPSQPSQPCRSATSLPRPGRVCTGAPWGRVAGRGRSGRPARHHLAEDRSPSRSPRRDRAAKDGLHRVLLGSLHGWLPWGGPRRRRGGTFFGLGGGTATLIAITPWEAAGDTAPGQDGPTASRGDPGRRAGDRRPRRQGTAGATIPRTWSGGMRWPPGRATDRPDAHGRVGRRRGAGLCHLDARAEPLLPARIGILGPGGVTDRHHRLFFCLL